MGDPPERLESGAPGGWTYPFRPPRTDRRGLGSVRSRSSRRREIRAYARRRSRSGRSRRVGTPSGCPRPVTQVGPYVGAVSADASRTCPVSGRQRRTSAGAAAPSNTTRRSPPGPRSSRPSKASGTESPTRAEPAATAPLASYRLRTSPDSPPPPPLRGRCRRRWDAHWRR
jgi:hypothetical protein